MTQPEPKQWFIFRHGLATLSRTGYGDRIVTAEVLPEGIPPVRRLARHLSAEPYDYGARSEFIRCRQTAEIVTEMTGRTFTPDPRLNEQVKEPFDSVRARVLSFVEQMNAQSYQHIWVCTHGVIIAALRHLITRGDFTPANELDYVQPGELLVIHGTSIDVRKYDDYL